MPDDAERLDARRKVEACVGGDEHQGGRAVAVVFVEELQRDVLGAVRGHGGTERGGEAEQEEQHGELFFFCG